MMQRMIHFISGLPRSGSTLLANLLAQNPRLHATASSGLLDVLFNIRNVWNDPPELRAAADPQAKLRVLRGVLDAFYADVSRPIIFDKSRSWLAYLEMAEAILGRPARVLVPVRDLRDVLASFEKLWRRACATRQIPQEGQFFYEFQTLEGRCAVWTRGDQPVGLAYQRIQDALRRGFRDRLHFVHFNALTAQPRETMRQIYAFLGEDYFEHDFDNVQQVTVEDDEAYGFADLHTVRPRVEPTPPQWPALLGPVAELYAGRDLW